MIRTVQMNDEEYEYFQHVSGLEKTYKSTLAQMKLQREQAKKLAENVVQAHKDIEAGRQQSEAAERVLELAYDVLA